MKAIGVAPITSATEEQLIRMLHDSDSDVVLESYVVKLASEDMHFLEQIVSHTEFATSHSEFVVRVLRSALKNTTGGVQRKFVRRLAINCGLEKRLPQENSEGLKSLSPAQRDALEQLRTMTEVFFERVAAQSPVKLRLTPLVIGQSGTGKSHLVRLLGREMGMRILTLTVGSWIVQGARQEPSAYDRIAEMLSSDEPLLIFIDELDKFRAQDSAWSLAQLAEIFALLDRNISYTGTKENPWTGVQSRRLRENTMIIGAGTWDHLWTIEIGRSVGFTASEKSALEINEIIRKADLIPSELLNRFSSEWVILQPYSSADFQAIAARLQIPAGILDPAAGERSRRNYRFVEDAMTRSAIAERRRERQRVVRD